MKEVVDGFKHLILLKEQGLTGEGFPGTVRVVVPLDFEGARVRYLPVGDHGDGDIRFGVFVAKTGARAAGLRHHGRWG